MSDQEVTYTELKFHNPMQEQKGQRNEKTKRKDTPSLPWRFIALTLGIFCLALLVTVGILGAAANRWQEKFIHQEEILENVTWQHKILENQSQQLKEIQEKTSQENKDLQAKNEELSKSLWSLQSKGNKCRISYYFTTKLKTWFECRTYCSSRSFRMVKIDSKEDQDFLKTLDNISYWIGLSRIGADSPWLWEYGTALSADLSLVQKGYYENCAAFSFAAIYPNVCTITHSCACEKGDC